MRYKLLLVDDELANLRLLARLFSRDFECLTASSGAEAIRLLEQHDVAVVVTDQRMPQMTGIDLLRHTARLRPHMVRILLTGYTDVEVLVEAINSGLVYMYVTKPWSNEDLKVKISRACEHYVSNKKSNALTLANDRLLARLQDIKLSVVTSLAEMLRSRDEYAYDRAVRVRQYAGTIAHQMRLTEIQLEDLAAAALLHDLGEVAEVNVSTRARGPYPDRATAAQAHSKCETELLAAIPELTAVSDIVRFHRENFDGSGSPSGLGGEQIPLSSRILRVANEYDLMIQPKPPAASMRHDEAMRFLSQRAGKQFDPKVIQVLSELSHGERTQGFLTSIETPSPEDNSEPVYFDATFS